MRINILLLVIIVCLPSCCSDYLKESITVKRVPYQSEGTAGDVMTMDEIKDFALSLPSLYSIDPTTKASGFSKTIKEVIPLKNTSWRRENRKKGTVNMTDFIYIVNYEDEEGFCVISSNNAIEPVFAYSDKGNLSDTTSFPGIHIFMDSLGDLVANNGQPCSYYVDTGDTVYFYQYYRTRYEDLGSFDVGVTQYAKWGQNSPYNSVCSQALGFTCPTGCAATAIGQIMSYHHYPEQVLSYPDNQLLALNWSSYPDSFTQSGDFLPVATLLYRIGESVQMHYDVNASGANPYNVPSALQTFGYSSSSLQNYNQDAIISSLSHGWPVFICGYLQSGGGHAWIIENGHQFIFSTYYDYKVYDQYGGYHGIHSEEVSYSEGSVLWYYNWGWNGNYNGYYLANTYNTSVGDFSSNVKIISNIHPVSN